MSNALGNVQKFFLILAAAVFAAAPLFVRAQNHHPPETPAQLIFLGLAWLPALVGLSTYISSQKARFELQKEAVAELPGADEAGKFKPSLVAWLTGALLLTGVFLIVAILAAIVDAKHPSEAGIVYAGYGTYVSTLWFMLGRLNAHALSPRFLLNSALKAAIGILIGFIAATSLDFFGKASASTSAQMMLFMIGFFHDWALGYIRKKAVEIFQAEQNNAPKLPVSMIEGIDDATADLLDELGIASVQHLATQDPIELSMRSLYPIKRVIDWIDQALLVLRFRDTISAARDSGIRGIVEFLVIYQHAIGAPGFDWKDEAVETMKILAQKLGMPEGALYLMASTALQDDGVHRLYELWRASTTPTVGGSAQRPKPSATPILQVREPAEAVTQQH